MYKPYDPGKTTALFYNIWGGRHSLSYFLKMHAPQLDVVCLTEVTSSSVRDDTTSFFVHTSQRESEPPMATNCLPEITSALSGFKCLFSARGAEDMRCKKTYKVYPGVRFGSALLWRETLDVIKCASELVCKDAEGIRNPRMLQWIVFEKGNHRYLLAHLHGVWIADNTKGDHPLRQQQSREVRQILARLSDELSVSRIVFGGDLNLGLETEALAQLLAGPGFDVVFENLITRYQIESTRTDLYRKYHIPGETQYADYVIVSPDVEVHDFTVDTNVRISDHAPLVVRFS